MFVLVEAGAFRSLSWENRFLGGLFWWVVLCVFLLAVFPAGTYFAQWSLFFAAAGCAVAFLVVPKEEKGLTLAAVLAFAFGLPALLLAVPALFGFFSTLTILFTPVLVLLLAFFLALLLPLWDSVSRGLRGGFVFGAAALALAHFVIALAIGGPSRDRPEWTCLSYGLDLDTSSAHWLSNDLRPHAWNSSCFPAPPLRETIQEYMPWDTLTYMKAEAPVAEVSGPEVTLISDEEKDGAREVTLFVRSPEGAAAATLYTENTVLSANILGIKAKGGEGGWWRTIHTLPPEGAEVVLRVPSNEPLRLKVVERFYGLPEIEGLPPRPESFIGEPNTTFDHNRQLRSDHVFIARTFEFPPSVTAAAARSDTP